MPHVLLFEAKHFMYYRIFFKKIANLGTPLDKCATSENILCFFLSFFNFPFFLE